MRALTAIPQAAGLWATERGGARRAIAGRRLKNISLCKPPKIFAPAYRPLEARRQAVLKFGAVEGNQGRLSRSAEDCRSWKH